MSLAYLSGLSYSGCYTDLSATSNANIITGRRGTDPAMTVALCLNICFETAGYTYLGLSAGDTCSCGPAISQNSKSALCDMPCAGKSTINCGGFKNGMSIYHIDDRSLARLAISEVSSRESSAASIITSTKIDSNTPISFSTTSTSLVSYPTSLMTSITSSTISIVSAQSTKSSGISFSSLDLGMDNTFLSQPTYQNSIIVVTVSSMQVLSSGLITNQSQTSANVETQNSFKTNIIAACGSVVGLFLVAVIIYLCMRRREKKLDTEIILFGQNKPTNSIENRKLEDDKLHPKRKTLLEQVLGNNLNVKVRNEISRKNNQEFLCPPLDPSYFDNESHYNRSISESELFGHGHPIAVEERCHQTISSERSEILMPADQRKPNAWQGRSNFRNDPSLIDNLPLLNPPVIRPQPRLTNYSIASRLKNIDWTSWANSKNTVEENAPENVNKNLELSSLRQSRRIPKVDTISKSSKRSPTTINSDRLSRGLTEVSY